MSAQVVFEEDALAFFPTKKRPQYIVKVAAKKSELRRTYEIRYQAYCHEISSLPPDAYPDGCETDCYDADSVVFAGYHLDGRSAVLSGTCRLIASEWHPFLMETGEEAFRIPGFVPRHATRELSRIARIPVKGFRQLTPLLIGASAWSLLNGVKFWVSALGKDHCRSLMDEGWPFRIFGENDRYHQTKVYAITLNLSEMKEFLRTIRAEFFPEVIR